MFKFADDIVSAVSRAECAKLAELAAEKVVLELGSHTGRSTVALASVAKLVHAVDWLLGDIHAGKGDSAPTFLANIMRHRVREKVVLHLGRFEDVLPLLRPESFDMIFIDALHTKEAVQKDAASAVPLLKPGGVMAFHDYGRPQFGVTEAVEEFAKSVGKAAELTESLAVVRLG